MGKASNKGLEFNRRQAWIYSVAVLVIAVAAGVLYQTQYNKSGASFLANPAIRLSTPQPSSNSSQATTYMLASVQGIGTVSQYVRATNSYSMNCTAPSGTYVVGHPTVGTLTTVFLPSSDCKKSSLSQYTFISDPGSSGSQTGYTLGGSQHGKQLDVRILPSGKLGVFTTKDKAYSITGVGSLTVVEISLATWYPVGLYPAVVDNPVY